MTRIIKESPPAPSAEDEAEEWQKFNNWFGFDQNHPHRGYLYERTQFNHWEASFAGEWEEWGHRILELLWDYNIQTTPRENFIIATIIQWLGTNVGSSFLQACLNRCGAVILWPTIIDPYTSWKNSRDPDYRDSLIAELLKANLDHDAKQLLFDLSEPT